MNSEQKAAQVKKTLEAMFILAGPLHTENGARYHVRSYILELLETRGYERTYYLANDFKRDCKVQATNEKQTPEARAQYAAQAKAWQEFFELFN